MVSYYTYNAGKLTVSDFFNKSLKGSAELVPLELFEYMHNAKYTM